MNEPQGGAMPPSRREFLNSLLATGGAAALAAHSVATLEGGSGDTMPRRVLGRTKQSVTILGLGCAYASGGVSETQTRSTIEAALEGGVRYFDAAPEYEQAEVRLGPVLAPVRKQVFLVSKTYARDAKQAEKDLATALEQLQTDYVDLFLQHGVGLQPIATNKEILGPGGSLEFLRKAKKQGLARFVGMSVHWPHAAALQLLDASDEWDVIMPFVNYLTHALERTVTRGRENLEEQTERLLPRARRDNLGIVAMKVLGGSPGPLADDYDRAFRYALSLPGVACALIGTRNVDEVNRAVRAAKAFRPFTDDEMNETIRKGEEMVRARSTAAIILDRHRKGDFGSLRRA